MMEAAGDAGRQGTFAAREIDLSPAPGEVALSEAELTVLQNALAKVTQDASYGQVAAAPLALRGKTVVFSGAGGEAKLTGAKALAREAGQPLYQVALGQVVSKYIGETEKNLGLVFQQAENGGAILLFDEADSLFGKRSDVKDSHDRYANLSPDVFLKARAAFSGTVILNTESEPVTEGDGDSQFGREVRFPLLAEG